MSATITTTFKDNSKEWLANVKKAFVEAGGKAEDFDAQLEAVNKELESRSAATAAANVRKLADEMDGTASAARNLAAEQAAAADKAEAAQYELAEAHKRTTAVIEGNARRREASARVVERANKEAAESDGGGRLAANITAASASAIAIIQILKKVQQAARMAYEGITILAETSPAYATLKKEIDGVGSAVKEVAEKFAATDFGAKGIEFATARFNDLQVVIRSAPTAWQDSQIAAQKYYAAINEGAGLGSVHNKRAIADLELEKDAIQRKFEEMVKVRAIEKSGEAAEQIRAAAKKLTDDAEYSRMVASLETTEQITKAIKDQEKTKEDIRKAGKLEGEAAETQKNKLLKLYTKEQQLIDERNAKLKQARDDEKKKDEEYSKAKYELARKTEEDIRNNAIEEIQRVQRERIDSMMDTWRKQKQLDEEEANRKKSIMDKFSALLVDQMTAGKHGGGGGFVGVAAGGGGFGGGMGGGGMDMIGGGFDQGFQGGGMGGGFNQGMGGGGFAGGVKPAQKPAITLQNLRQQLAADKKRIAALIIKNREDKAAAEAKQAAKQKGQKLSPLNEQRARMKARSKARKDIGAGKADAEANDIVDKSFNNVVDATIKTMEASGKFNNELIQSSKNAVNLFRQKEAELNDQGKAIQIINQTMQQMLNGQMNKQNKAQAAGFPQGN